MFVRDYQPCQERQNAKQEIDTSLVLHVRLVGNDSLYVFEKLNSSLCWCCHTENTAEENRSFPTEVFCRDFGMDVEKWGVSQHSSSKDGEKSIGLGKRLVKDQVSG
jgi:hypothetical protein